MEMGNELLYLVTHGLDIPDAGLTTVRVAVGSFFAISGYHKLFVPERHASLTRNLTKNNIPAVGFMQWWVPGWELAAGAMLAVGLFSAFSAFVLMVICFVACLCEARERVAAFKPIDIADEIDDYLYLQEVLYLIMLAVTMFSGPGKYSLDALFF